MKWLSRLFPDRGDPNALLDEERAVFEQVVAQWHADTRFAALRLQLLEWLTAGRVESFPGAADWFQRRASGDGISLRTKRLIGAYFLLPKSFGRVQLDFPLQPAGTLTFFLDEVIKEIVFSGVGNARLPANLQVGEGRFGDDRPYWERQKAEHADFADIASGALDLLERRKATLDEPIVLLAPGAHVTEIANVTLPESYVRLLAFASSLVINAVSIWGNGPLRTYVETIGEAPWLYVGTSLDEGLLLLRMRDSVASDELYLFTSRAAPRPWAANAIEAARKALARRIPS